MIRIGFIVAVMVIAGCSSSKTEKQSAVSASQIKLTNLDGSEVDLTDYKGKTIFVNIWATWCRPCIQEIPSIVALQKQLAGKNIEFFFASDEAVEKIQNFMKSRSMSTNFVRIENPEALGIEALPTTFIFDGDGNVVFSEVGYRKWDDPAMIDMVSKLMKNGE